MENKPGWVRNLNWHIKCIWGILFVAFLVGTWCSENEGFYYTKRDDRISALEMAQKQANGRILGLEMKLSGVMPACFVERPRKSFALDQ